MAEPSPAAEHAAASPADAPRPPTSAEEFFRRSFRELVRAAMIAGASQQEAEDAASRTLTDILAAWATRDYTLAYARKAVVSNFIKEKVRGPSRVARRLIERGHVPVREGAEDPLLTAFEGDQWVTAVLSTLPLAQREVMECIAAGLDRDEIAGTLGKSKEAVRRNLCDARARLAAELHPDGEPRLPFRGRQRAARKEA